MRKFEIVLAAIFLPLAAPATAQDIPPGTPLRDACQRIATVPDACALVAEAATLLAPTYRIPKRTGEAELRRMGYEARIVADDVGDVGDVGEGLGHCALRNLTGLVICRHGHRASRSRVSNRRVQE